jgi:hypothetical protein
MARNGPANRLRRYLHTGVKQTPKRHASRPGFDPLPTQIPLTANSKAETHPLAEIADLSCCRGGLRWSQEAIALRSRMHRGNKRARDRPGGYGRSDPGRTWSRRPSEWYGAADPRDLDGTNISLTCGCRDTRLRQHHSTAGSKFETPGSFGISFWIGRRRSPLRPRPPC